MDDTESNMIRPPHPLRELPPCVVAVESRTWRRLWARGLALCRITVVEADVVLLAPGAVGRHANILSSHGDKHDRGKTQGPAAHTLWHLPDTRTNGNGLFHGHETQITLKTSSIVQVDTNERYATSLKERVNNDQDTESDKRQNTRLNQIHTSLYEQSGQPYKNVRKLHMHHSSLSRSPFGQS